MKNSLALLFALLSTGGLFFLNSCSSTIEGSGPLVTKNLSISEFSCIELDLPATVILSISDSVQGVLRAQSNIAELIEFKQNDDELEIQCKEGYKTSLPVEIELSTRVLEKIQVNGSGDLKVVNPVKGKGLRVDLNGSGNVEVEVNVEKLRTTLDGTGNVKYSGKSISHTVRISGTGNVKAEELQTEDCDVRIDGSGDAELFVNSELEAIVMGSGKVRYKGTPEVKSEINGSGDVKKKN